MLRIQPRSWICLCAGLFITGVEIYGCVEYLLGQPGHGLYIVILGGAVTGAAALIPMAIEMSLRDRRWILAIASAIVFVPASATIFLAAVERTGSARDVVVAAQGDAGVKLSAALRAEADAKREADDSETEARRGCASGRGDKCKGLETRADNARQRLSRARLDVVAAGSPPLDPQARRVAAMLNVTEQQVQLYGPIILPVTGSLLGALFLAVGCRMHREVIIPKLLVHKADPPKRAAEEITPIQLPPSPSIGNVARFMVECMPAATGQRVEIADAYVAYKTWCNDERYAYLPPVEFRVDFLAVCKRAKMATKREAGKLYCEGRMIAA